MSESFMWTELNCRKIPTIWKMWTEPRCREISTIWKERKFWFDRIVGKFQQFERCVLDWIVGKYLQFERCVQENGYDYTIWKEWKFWFDQIVSFDVNWIKFVQFEKSESLNVDWTNCRKIPTIWKMCIELNCRKIPTIWKMSIELNCRKLPTIWKMCEGKLLWLYDLKRVNFLCGFDQIVGKFLQFEICGLN